MIDDLMPAFAKLTPRRNPEDDDPLQLGPDALSLEGLQKVYRNPRLPLQTRMRAMMAAIPYESPKLAVTAVVSQNDFASMLDQRLERMKALEQQKLISAQPQQVETKPQLAHTPDRRFRRI